MFKMKYYSVDVPLYVFLERTMPEPGRPIYHKNKEWLGNFRDFNFESESDNITLTRGGKTKSVDMNDLYIQVLCEPIWK